MEFRALGPVEVRDGDQVLPVNGPRQRTVLAALMLDVGRVVSVDRLIEAIWSQAPPATAHRQVLTSVSRLRRILGGLIVTKAPGYLLAVEPDAIDVEVFDTRVAAARNAVAKEHLREASEQFDAALKLWNGPALGGVMGMMAEAGRLEEQRQAALEERLHIDLVLGRCAEVATELAVVVGQYPLRERPIELLMRALHGCGRRADALAVYRAAQLTFSAELGLDLSSELQRLHDLILNTGGPRLIDPSRSGLPTPAQLPLDVLDFTGRTAQVRELSRSLAGDDRAGERAQALAVSAIAGMGGVGKSALAVHVAHRTVESFPDGQLYADMCGAQGRPLDPGEVLTRFLHALGMAPGTLPQDLDEQVKLYRSVIMGRRVLILLDNAVREEQVRPLLPGSPSCAVLVTSRVRLTGLEGVRHLDLDVLDSDQAVDLLARIVGPERVEAEPAAAAEIVRLCDHLPLAVRVAAARLLARSHWPLAKLAEALRDERRRLTVLASGDLTVRGSIARGYRELDTVVQPAFRSLGPLPVPDFATWVGSALWEVSTTEAEATIEALVDARLVETVRADATGRLRYRLPELIRCFARDLAEKEPAAVRAALTRVLGAWLALAGQAADRLPPSVLRPLPGSAPRWRLPAATADPLTAAPLSWFAAERSSLLAAVDIAAATGLEELAWELAAACVPYFDQCGLLDDWRSTHEKALSATRAAGNLRGEAAMLRGIGHVSAYRDDYHDAEHFFEQSRRCCQQIGDEHGEFAAVMGLGVVARMQGRNEEALGLYHRALTVFLARDDKQREAHVRNSIGSVKLAQGHMDEAHAWFKEALQLAWKADDQHRAAKVFINMGELYLSKKAALRALDFLRRALSILESIGDASCAAFARLGLARAHAALRERALAESTLASASAMFQSTGNRKGAAACTRLAEELSAC